MATKRVLNQYSLNVTQPRSQGASQAMLYATGLTREDMNKPQVGISSNWYDREINFSSNINMYVDGHSVV